MLFSVEGGGFFSSSASGYSKGLTLLFLGQKSEERSMRVTSWNHYQLVDQGIEPDLQLASGKSWPVCGCDSFKCFGHASAALDSPSSFKVGSSLNHELFLESTVCDDIKDSKISADNPILDDDINKIKINSLKSSLKKADKCAVVASAGASHGAVEKNNVHESLSGKNDDEAYETGRRKVQWTDTTGGELFEIREFGVSEDGSDNEFDHTTEKTCSCRIM